MAYTVAQAEVTVTPDARNFGRDLRAQIAPDAEKIGRQIGDDIARGLRERLATARPDVNVGADTSAASRKVDTFLAETKAKATVAGREAGSSLGKNMADEAGASFSARGALIGSAIGLGLIAGAPLLVAAGGVLMGGLAAVIVHNAPAVEQAANEVGHSFTEAFTEAASGTIPMFALALKEVSASAKSMAAAVKPAFDSLNPAIQGVTQGVLGLVQQALPGLVRAIQVGAPVFAGLQSMLTSIGSGLGNFFSIISEHGPAMGVTLAALGSVLDELFQTLGLLTGAGSELGSMVLPVLADALGAVNDVLQFLSPILPEIVLGLLGLKAASMMSGLLTSFAASLESVGANAMVSIGALRGCEAAGLAAGTGFAAAAGGARGLQAAMGPIGWIMLAISVAIPLLSGALGHQETAQDKVKDSADKMSAALERSKGLIDDNVRATAAASAQNEGLLAWADKWGVAGSTIVDALLGQQSAMDQVTEAAARYKAGQDELTLAEKGQLDKDTGAQAKADAYANEALASANAADQLGILAGNTRTNVTEQTNLKNAIEGSASAQELNNTRLHALADAASAGNSEINLLKGALDALTGKSVSLGDAEVAVTNAVLAASTALKDKTGRLVDDKGAIDLHTEAGAALWTSMTNIAEADNKVIATMEKHGASTAEVTKRDAELREQFIATADQMGMTREQAEALANQIYGIPEERHTEITADTNTAEGRIKAIHEWMDMIKDKHVKIVVDTYGADGSLLITGGKGGQGGLHAAMGGIVKPFADGGFNPMDAGQAAVVAPNTWRVIGDRVSDDEAYIPINDSARSLSILAQTAGRMGFDLSRPDGSGRTDARHYEFNISAAADPQAIARSVREAQMDVEFLYG